MSKVGELDPDVMDCGGPLETWQEMSKHLRWRACNSRSLARESRSAAEDAAEQADYFAAQAEDFDALASAIENANVTFAASADTHPKDGDVKQAPLVSGAVPKADAQNHLRD